MEEETLVVESEQVSELGLFPDCVGSQEEVVVELRPVHACSLEATSRVERIAFRHLCPLWVLEVRLLALGGLDLIHVSLY